jgi:hypothetical protein
MLITFSFPVYILFEIVDAEKLQVKPVIGTHDETGMRAFLLFTELSRAERYRDAQFPGRILLEFSDAASIMPHLQRFIEHGVDHVQFNPSEYSLERLDTFTTAYLLKYVQTQHLG